MNQPLFVSPCPLLSSPPSSDHSEPTVSASLPFKLSTYTWPTSLVDLPPPPRPTPALLLGLTLSRYRPPTPTCLGHILLLTRSPYPPHSHHPLTPGFQPTASPAPDRSKQATKRKSRPSPRAPMNTADKPPLTNRVRSLPTSCRSPILPPQLPRSFPRQFVPLSQSSTSAIL